MSIELPSRYNPKDVEDRIYRTWEDSGLFNPDKLRTNGKGRVAKDKTYAITVPPPNVTGSLHMGHALNAVIQDILIRKKRMEGFKTLWIPGTDHAGIATQNVVEKQLKKEENLTRHDIGREELLRRIWQWKEKYGNTILEQFKKLGSSMDWSRTRFTMDPEYQEAVKHAFLHYYKKGWIYQGERCVNWCTRCATSLSDLEVEYKEEDSEWYEIQYGPLVIGTTRPETKVGDTAIAVNPKDARYKKYIGRELEVETVLGPATMKVVADPEIDMAFGTGAMKVTPAHDLHDFELAEKYKLEKKQVIGPDGRMTALAGKYAGLKVAEARKQIAEDLQNKGLLVSRKPYRHNVAVCYRCGTHLEPVLSKQWFLKMDELAKYAIQAVRSGKVKFHPKRWEKVYLERLKNERDWTISRQIWWGHPVPVAQCLGCGMYYADPKIEAHWYFVRHGQTDWNLEKRIQGQSANTSINETGRQQVSEVVRQLKRQQIDLIISSDALRAKETAEIIGNELGAEVVFDPALRERSYGVLEGSTREELAAKGLSEEYQKIFTHELAPDDGESFKEVEERMHRALMRHKTLHKGHKNIVVVSHGAAIKSLLRRVKNLSVEEVEDIEMRNAQILRFSVGTRCRKCRSEFIEPEQDVLDTWFSSALWPFATLGWPKKTKDLKTFYPTQVLSTARDIINLWVSRMVFSGLEFMGSAPFRDVIIHATVLTKEGRRMSKSLGTGIDPMVLIEKYGADATRFGLIWQYMGGQDIHFDETAMETGRRFITKLWNATRFMMMRSADRELRITESVARDAQRAIRKTDDRRALKKLDGVIKATNRDVERYEFGRALRRLYDFFWEDVANSYLEKTKNRTDAAAHETLETLLETSMKLLHPFIPFVTEELWGIMRKNHESTERLLAVERWPEARV
ncbi:MAG: class I tRNA ligase family protein [bacterium]|nr:class I tRNA ligase family protein [bacterium]MDZ4296085.1 class I tRNA ligase family protein [Patescibacteria group bacterium]